jgi:hypothetical protein
MQPARTVGLIALTATGMLLLYIGMSAQKVAHLGVRFVPIMWLAAMLPLSYQTICIIFMVLGFCLMLIPAELCRRAEKRALDALPGTSSWPTFRFVLGPSLFIAVTGVFIVEGFFRTNF